MLYTTSVIIETDEVIVHRVTSGQDGWTAQTVDVTKMDDIKGLAVTFTFCESDSGENIDFKDDVVTEDVPEGTRCDICFG